MEDNITKACPLCQAEIKEGDVVKVCPTCGIPHHETCWEKNGGCSNSGCAEQHDEPLKASKEAVCTVCGAILDDGRAFCPKCGAENTPVVETIEAPVVVQPVAPPQRRRHRLSLYQ